VRDLVETALGVVLVACLGLAALLLPCALIDIAAGTTLLGPVTVTLLLCFSAAAILGVVAVQQRRYSDKSGHPSSENKDIAGNGGTADRADKSDWRRR
jgi:membrane protein implicated in regulation of membrane protease activity